MSDGPAVRPRPRSSVLPRPFPLAVAAVVLLALALNMGGLAGPARAQSPSSTPGSPATVVNMTTLFDGTPTAGHTSPSTAIATTFDRPFALQIDWSAHGGALGRPILVTVDGARATIPLLGQPIVTQEVDEQSPVATPSGSLNATLGFTQDRYLVEGVYLVQVTLLGPNGTNEASQSFYIHVTAPYHLVALNVALGALILYELYAVLTIGRRGRAHARAAARGGM